MQASEEILAEEILAMPRRAHSYRRISDPKSRKGDGLNRQADFAQRLCDRHGWVLDDSLIFVDKGRSGFHADHRRGKGQLLAFLDAVRRKRITPGSVLIIENLDRLSREEMDEAHDLFKSILKAGIWIATEMPERIYTRESLKSLVGTIEPLLHMYVAHEHSKKLSWRIADKWERRRERAREAKTPFGRGCPAWMELTPDGYHLIPSRAATVQKIYSLAMEGMGAHRIGAWLKAHASEHPPFGPSGQWSCAYILQILRKRASLGEYQPCKGHNAAKRQKEGEAIPNYYPAVVTEDEWRMAQLAVDRRKKTTGRPGQCEANLFTGIVWEAVTSRRMCIVTSTSRYQGTVSYHRYLMAGDNRSGCGIGKGFPYAPFEQAILRALEELRPQDVLPPGAEHEKRQLRIVELTRRDVALDHRIEEIRRAIADPQNKDIQADLAPSLRAVRDERKTVQKELEKLNWESRTGMAQSLAETQTLIDLMKGKSGEELAELRRRVKAAIRWLVDSIWIISQPCGSRAYIGHVQIYLRNGTRRPLQILPLGRNGNPLPGLKPWDLGSRDFRGGDVGHVARDAQSVPQVAG